MPRPTHLTIEIQTRICALVNGGAPIPLACKAAGISFHTVKDWMRKGRDGQAPYDAFVTAVEQAKAAWACSASLRVTKASSSDWKAAAWLLERRVKAFRPPQRHEVKANVQGGDAPIKVEHAVSNTMSAALADSIIEHALGVPRELLDKMNGRQKVLEAGDE